MIDARAARLQKKTRAAIPRLPLDFAQLVASRRANRVAEHKQLEANNHHQYDIQKAVDLENQFNERHRMEDRLRLGGLPASISHPIAAAMAREVPVQPAAAMEVDAAGRREGIVEAVGAFQQFHRTKERLEGRPHMEDFTPEEELVGRSSRNRALYPAAVVSRNVKQRARSRSGPPR